MSNSLLLLERGTPLASVEIIDNAMIFETVSSLDARSVSSASPDLHRQPLPGRPASTAVTTTMSSQTVSKVQAGRNQRKVLELVSQPGNGQPHVLLVSLRNCTLNAT